MFRRDNRDSGPKERKGQRSLSTHPSWPYPVNDFIGFQVPNVNDFSATSDQDPILAGEIDSEAADLLLRSQALHQPASDDSTMRNSNVFLDGSINGCARLRG